MTHSFRKFSVASPVACLILAGAVLPRARADAQSPWLPEMKNLMVGFHYGAPLKWSLAIGVPLTQDVTGWTPFVAAEPGLGGWRASVGAIKSLNDLGTGYVVRATVLRTTSKAWRAPSQATYVGPEFQVMPLFAIGARVGALFRVGGNGSQRGLLTADVSLMF